MRLDLIFSRFAAGLSIHARAPTGDERSRIVCGHQHSAMLIHQSRQQGREQRASCKDPDREGERPRQHSPCVCTEHGLAPCCRCVASGCKLSREYMLGIAGNGRVQYALAIEVAGSCELGDNGVLDICHEIIDIPALLVSSVAFQCSIFADASGAALDKTVCNCVRVDANSASRKSTFRRCPTVREGASPVK